MSSSLGYATIRVNAGADMEDWWKRIFGEQIQSCTQTLSRTTTHCEYHVLNSTCDDKKFVAAFVCVWVYNQLSIHIPNDALHEKNYSIIFPKRFELFGGSSYF